MPTDNVWPALVLSEWKDTYTTLHMYSQVVGKVRLALAPPVNHWWGTALYVDARGLTTSVMPQPTKQRRTWGTGTDRRSSGADRTPRRRRDDPGTAHPCLARRH